MKLGKISLLFLTLSILVFSCKKDDNIDDPIVVEARDRGEQQLADNDSLVKYLETHYYNSDAFIGNSDPSISDIIITDLEEDGYTLLKDAVETISIVYKGVDTSYDFYVLRLNQGGGDSPNFTDNIKVLYEGFLLDGTIFDKNDVVESSFDLLGVVEGWRRVMPLFNTAESFIEVGDGTINYLNSGLGVMFLPSGLGYFSGTGPTGGLSAYSPLIFKFELLRMSENDHDADGVPSYLEDLDGDGEFYVNFDDLTDATDDDTDGNGFANFNDSDDDGDGVLTINEDIDGDGDPTNDIGANGIPKYLDATETESKP